MQPLLIVAHRGGDGPFPENSLEAFKHALDHGANGVEMDVRFDHLRRRFYLEHDFVHFPKDNRNVIDKIIPSLPKGTKLFLDLKTNAWIQKRYARKFLELLRKYDVQNSAVIMSFNPFVLLHLRKLDPDIEIGFICGNHFWSNLFKQWIFKALKPQFLFLHRRMLKNSILGFAQSHKLKILAFSVDKNQYWQKIKEFHLDGIITDFPEKAAEALNG